MTCVDIMPTPDVEKTRDADTLPLEASALPDAALSLCHSLSHTHILSCVSHTRAHTHTCRRGAHVLGRAPGRNVAMLLLLITLEPRVE